MGGSLDMVDFFGDDFKAVEMRIARWWDEICQRPLVSPRRRGAKIAHDG